MLDEHVCSLDTCLVNNHLADGCSLFVNETMLFRSLLSLDNLIGECSSSANGAMLDKYSFSLDKVACELRRHDKTAY